MNFTSLLKEFSNYVKPKYKNYEENFVPHITIARGLSENDEMEALTYLTKDYACEAVVESAILSIVKENTPEESKNILNQTVYKL